MRVAGLALCCLFWLPAVWAGPLPAPVPCEALPDGELADAFEQLALRGRLHEDVASGCLQRLREQAGADPELATANDLRQARRVAALGRRAEGLVLARAALQASRPDQWLRTEADVTLGELLLQDEALTEARTRLDAAIERGPAEGWRHLRALLAASRVAAFLRDGSTCTARGDRALAVAERDFGPQHTATAMALVAVATCHRIGGDHGASIAALERGLAIVQATGPHGNHLLTAQMLLMLGQAHKISGDFPRAERGYLRALEHLRAHPEPVPRELAGTLHGLANLERDDGRPELSLARYAEAIALFEQVYGGSSMRLSQVLNNYGNALSLVGRNDEAVATYEQALALAQSRGADVDPATFAPISNIAQVRLKQQRYDEAETGFRRGIELTKGTATGGESGLLFAQLGLAASLWGQGRHREAFAEAERAEQERQLALAMALATLSDAGGVDFQEYLRPGLDLVIAIAYDSSDADLVARAWTLAMAARGQVTAHTSARLAAARSSAAPQLQAAFARWRQASAELARLRLSQPKDDDPALPAAEDALASAERAMAAAAPDAMPVLQRAALSDVLAHLPGPDATLIGFASSGLRAGNDYARPDAAAPARDVYAFVGGQHRPPVLYRLLAEDELTVLVGRWRRAAGDPDSGSASLLRSGSALRRSVFDPLRIEDDGIVLMVAYGDLHQVNPAALPDAAGGYLLDRGLRVHNLNHELDLLRPAASAAAAAPLRVLAVGDPAFSPPGADGPQPDDRTGAAAACSDGRWRSLPGSRREVAALAERLPAQARLTALTGEQASKGRVLAALPGQHLIHLATHGLHRSGDCQPPVGNSRAVSLSPDPSGSAGADADDGLGMLVLASEPDQPGASLLGESDIVALALEPAQWVVLSACDTGLAHSRAYEGAFGLRRAFHLAGARTVIMSLWRIDDAATVDWMSALYQHRFGATPATTIESLFQAQRDVLAQRRSAGLSDHPYYWAGFVAAGDWR